MWFSEKRIHLLSDKKHHYKSARGQTLGNLSEYKSIESEGTQQNHAESAT